MPSLAFKDTSKDASTFHREHLYGNRYTIFQYIPSLKLLVNFGVWFPLWILGWLFCGLFQAIPLGKTRRIKSTENPPKKPRFSRELFDQNPLRLRETSALILYFSNSRGMAKKTNSTRQTDDYGIFSLRKVWLRNFASQKSSSRPLQGSLQAFRGTPIVLGVRFRIPFTESSSPPLIPSYDQDVGKGVLS